MSTRYTYLKVTISIWKSQFIISMIVVTWDKQIMLCIERGLHKSLGISKATDLTLKTLEIAYELYKKDISCSLDVFESLMEKMFGQSGAHTILANIANECRNMGELCNA